MQNTNQHYACTGFLYALQRVSCHLDSTAASRAIRSSALSIYKHRTLQRGLTFLWLGRVLPRHIFSDIHRRTLVTMSPAVALNLGALILSTAVSSVAASDGGFNPNFYTDLPFDGMCVSGKMQSPVNLPIQSWRRRRRARRAT